MQGWHRVRDGPRWVRGKVGTGQGKDGYGVKRGQGEGQWGMRRCRYRVGTGRGGMEVSYLRGWPDDGEQDWQQHQPIEQPQQRQDGEHRKEVPGGWHRQRG